MADPHDDADSQDLAEVFDETNTTRDGSDIADPDMAPGVYDVTSTEDDDDPDEEDPDDFDPDEMDEAQRETMLEEDDGVDSPRSLAADGADLVPDGVGSIEDGGLNAGDTLDEDARLDEALDETFPASDPLDLQRKPG